MAWTSSKYGNFLLWSLIWPWSSRSIKPQNNRDLNQGVLLFWSKFGDSSLNGWQVIARTSKWLPHTQTYTQTQTRIIPEGQNWPRVKMLPIHIISISQWKCVMEKSISLHRAWPISKLEREGPMKFVGNGYAKQINFNAIWLSTLPFHVYIQRASKTHLVEHHIKLWTHSYTGMNE